MRRCADHGAQPQIAGPAQHDQRGALVRRAETARIADHHRRPPKALPSLGVNDQTRCDRDIAAVGSGQAEQSRRAAQVVSLELRARLLGGKEREDGSNRARAPPTARTHDSQCRHHVAHEHRRGVVLGCRAGIGDLWARFSFIAAADLSTRHGPG